MTFNYISWEAFKTYLVVDRKLSTSPENMNSFKSRFNLIRKYFNTHSFNRDNFNTFIYDYKINGYKNEYLNKLINCAKHLDRFCKVNCIQDYTLFKQITHLYDVLTDLEMSKIESLSMYYAINPKLRNKMFYCFYRLLHETGCRISEALHLLHEDVKDKAVIFRMTKNREIRQVPISNMLYREIKTLDRRGERVFFSTRENSLSKATVYADLKERVIKLKIKKRVWTHLFRHSMATTMIKHGVDTLTLARILGHKSLDSTQRYNQTRIAHLRKAMYRYNPSFKSI